MNLPDSMWAVRVDSGMKAVRTALPPRHPGDCLVKIQRIGICGTDLKMFEGYTDFQGIVGHEFAGTVIEADDPSWIGKRVTSSINLPPADADSSFDWASVKHHPRRRALGIRNYDGVMAEYASLPPEILVELPDSVDDLAGAMAEPLASALEAVEVLPKKYNPVLVVGDGRVAQLVIRVLDAAGLEVHLMGKHADKIKLAQQSGAFLRDKATITPETRYPAVIEATGSASGVQDALTATAPEGVLVLNTTLPHGVELDLARIVVDEIKLIGSRCGDICKAVALLEHGKINVDDMVSATYPLQEAETAFRKAQEKSSLKIQLVVN